MNSSSIHYEKTLAPQPFSKSSESTSAVKLLLVGIGGYAKFYLEALQSAPLSRTASICAIVDPFAENSQFWPALASAGIPRFTTIEQFVESGIQADLTVIISPIAFHADQSCRALKAGMHVLCEKPICATMEDARRMLAARDTASGFLEIGYQWCFSEAVQALKTDVLAGRLGAPRRLLNRVAWPRTNLYYARNNWAGSIIDPAGRRIYDSPVNNATAHYLHNMLYIVGSTPGRSATPVAVTAECYRANPIENFDAACCRVETQEGPEILFFTAHCVREEDGPVFRYEFEEAEVGYAAGGDIVARFANGETRNYGNPDADKMRKLKYCVQRCRSPQDSPTLCGPEAAIAHTLCVEGIQQMNVSPLPQTLVRTELIEPGKTQCYLPQMSEAIRLGFEQARLFSEMGMAWASPAQRIELDAPLVKSPASA